MCLTGVDYFSTLAYQPSIAFLAAGTLAPIATLVLIILTLFGALPMYHRVADMSPFGQGSILMLEKLFPRWKGKALVLSLLGFRGDELHHHDYAVGGRRGGAPGGEPSDAAWLQHPGLVTIVLLLLLGAIFLRGFQEAIGLAVVIVIAYLALNTVVLIVAAREIWRHPDVLANWRASLFAAAWQSRDDGADGGHPVPQARARAVGLRNRRGGHAAGARRSDPIRRRTRREESATPRSCCRRRR